MASGIYGIHNLINDKWYVGQATNIRARWAAHRSLLSRKLGESIHLLRAWQKYGPGAFEWVVLEECSPDRLDEREIYWIAKKDSFRNGYNRTIGGGGIHGYKQPPARVAKMRETAAKMWADPEKRKEINSARLRVTQSEEYRKKLSAAQRKNWSNSEFKELSLKRMQEGARNPEVIEKRNASLRRAFMNPASKAKLSQASKRNWASKKYREKMEAARSLYMNDQYRENARIQSIKRWQSETYRELVRSNLSKAKRNLAPEILQVETGRIYNSIADAAEELGISYHHILSVCYGKRRKAGDFHWRFASETQEEWDARRAAFLDNAGIKAFPKVVCIETGEVFEQPKTAAESVDVHPSNITKVCSGDQLTAGGYHWRYYNESAEVKAKREALIFASESRVLGEHSQVRIRCVETGMIYDSVNGAAEALNINRSGISNALRGAAKTAGGFHWEYVDSDRPGKYGSRRIICVETGIVYQSLQEAANTIGIHRSGISNVLLGKNKTAGGFHWEYYEDE